MSYIITFTNGAIYETLGTGVVDNKLGVSLLGPTYVNYGQLLANNFVRLLENQANNTAPTYPIVGQLWYDTSTADNGGQALKYYDGTKFKPCSSSELGPIAPPDPLDGDQWWNTTLDQLNVFNGNVWMVVGPGYTAGQGVSGLYNATVTDTGAQQHLISHLYLGANTVAIISKDTVYNLATPIEGITTVKTGINLVPNAVINGTSVNSQQLGNYLASEYVRNNTSGTITGSLGVTGTVTVGNVSVGPVNISSTDTISLISGNATVTANATSGTITVSNEPTALGSITTKNYVDTRDSVTLASAKSYTDSNVSVLLGTVGINTITTIAGLSSAIGNDPYYANNVTTNLGFKANIAGPTFTGNVGVQGSILPTANVSSDLGSVAYNFRHIYSQAISSVFADLAEKYESDNDYAVGTVVVFGGNKEITSSTKYCDPRIAGVVSKDPAYTMNNLSDGLAIALTGKVLCKVVGPVKKGDILVSSGHAGVATVLASTDQWQPGCVIGKSMANDSNIDIREVIIAVGRF